MIISYWAFREFGVTFTFACTGVAGADCLGGYWIRGTFYCCWGLGCVVELGVGAGLDYFYFF